MADIQLIQKDYIENLIHNEKIFRLRFGLLIKSKLIWSSNFMWKNFKLTL